MTWNKSSDSKYENQPLMIKAPIVPAPGYELDFGLELTQENKYYGLSKTFAEPISGAVSSEFVLQYEVKLETLNCGGAYLKLPRASPGLDLALMHDKTPYSIMFGPDRCGSNSKIHFIMQHENPLTHVWEEKHMLDMPVALADKNTHLYTLVIRPDNRVEVLVDMQVVKSGSLLADMSPAINPPALIDDETDKKPLDWVDASSIPDPAAAKPEDWDESQPASILDPSSTKPETWLDHEPASIPDPSARRPDDWDDEEDGEWEAPSMANPRCEEGGCGKWTQATMRNPDYKGKWKAPLITNPAYKGVWAPRQITNPNYFQDLTPANFAPVAGVAIEVWTTDAGINLDNIVIGNSQAEALAFAAETFGKKSAAEKVQGDAASKQLRNEARLEKMAQGGMAVVEVYMAEALEFVAENLVAAVVTFVLLVVALVVMCGGGGGSAKDKDKDAHEEGEEAVETSAPAAAASASAGLTVSTDSPVPVVSGTSTPVTPTPAATTDDDEVEEEEPVKSVKSGKGKKTASVSPVASTSTTPPKRKTRKDTAN